MSEGREFRIRPGKAKRSKAQGRNARGLVAEVLRVAAMSGGGKRAGWGGPRRRGQSSFGRGRTAFARSRLFGSGRRVLVKALPVRHRIGGRRMAPLSAHVAYLKREGVTRDGSQTRMFDAESDRANDRGFAERCKDDRHHFRIIVSPEDAADLTDLREYTRDLVRQMESDLGTRLDWVAVDHWNTDNPHVHLLVRGVTDQGADLVMARDYILVKPTRPDLTTNLVINTDRRTYHLELRATPATYMASVSWTYPQDQLIALRARNAAAASAAPVAAGLDVAALNFRYRIDGDPAPWKPLRAFDDGRQVFIEFPAGIAQGDMPPLFVIGAGGDAELVNFRVQGHYMVVDRLFAAAEMRLGDKHSAQRVRIVRGDGRGRS